MGGGGLPTASALPHYNPLKDRDAATVLSSSGARSRGDSSSGAGDAGIATVTSAGGGGHHGDDVGSNLDTEVAKRGSNFGLPIALKLAIRMGGSVGLCEVRWMLYGLCCRVTAVQQLCFAFMSVVIVSITRRLLPRARI
jgi:hypothetical protein